MNYMKQSKRYKASQSSKKAKVITPTLLLLFGASTLAYYLILAAIYALFGERLASWLANPLFGIAVFFITKWEGTRAQKNLAWRDYIKFPKLKIWKLLIVILTILLVQSLAGAAAGYYLVTVQPDIETNGILEGIYATTTTWGSLIIVMIGAVLAYFLGGYIAGKLCRYKYQAPYSHAAAGEFIYFSINFVWIQYLYVCDCGTTPTQEDIGIFALLFPLTMLLSIFGAWVATKTRLARSIDTFFHRIKARDIRTREQFSDSNKSVISLDSTSELSTHPKTSTEHALLNQHAAELSESEDSEFRAFIRQRTRGKKRRQRRK